MSSKYFSQYKPKSTYNADTATQSPSLASDLAINAAYSKPLQTEAAEGDAYPRIDYGSNNPFSQAANMGQYMTDQAAVAVQNASGEPKPTTGSYTDPKTTGDKPGRYTGPASERAHVPKYMHQAKKTFGMTRNEVLGTLDKAGIKNLDSERDITTLQGYFDKTGNNKPKNQVRKDAVSRAREYSKGSSNQGV